MDIEKSPSERIYANYAQQYYDMGFIPLPVDDTKKSCLIKEWNEIFVRDFTQKSLDQIIREKGDLNIGIVCGKASNVIGIDYDWEHEHAEQLEKLIIAALPETKVIKKGNKGWTRFYRFNPEIKKTSIKRLNGEKKETFVDILSDGPGLTVMPPSTKSRGGNYVFVDEAHTLLNTRSEELPLLLPEHVNEIRSIAKYGEADLKIATSEKSARHTTLFGKSIGLFKSGKHTAEEVAESLLKIDRHLHKTSSDPKGPYFEDVKYSSGQTPEQFALVTATAWVAWARAKFGENTFSVSQRIQNKFGFTLVNMPDALEKYPSSGSNFQVNVGRGDKVKLVDQYDEFCRFVHEACGLKFVNGIGFIFDKTHYRQVSDAALTYLTSELIGANREPSDVAAFQKALVVRLSESAEKNCNPRGLINVQNGVLDLESRTLSPHSRDQYFDYVLPFAFDKDAKCPRWQKFVHDIFPQDQTDENGAIVPHNLESIFQEIIGYIVEPELPWLEKAFVFIGEGANGKSTALKVIERLVGSENCARVGVNMLNKPFSVVQLIGKRLNLLSELSTRDADSAAFKTYVSAEPMVAAKKFKDEFTMIPECRTVIASNHFPVFHDQSHGAVRRLFMVPFNASFEGKNAIPNFYEQLCEELPGIFNWALLGLERVRENRCIKSNDIAIDRTMDEYRHHSDSIYAFFNAHAQRDENGEEHSFYVGDLYLTYTGFCVTEGRKPKSKAQFGAGMRLMIDDYFKRKGEGKRATLTHPKNKLRVCSILNFPNLVKDSK